MTPLSSISRQALLGLTAAPLVTVALTGCSSSPTGPVVVSGPAPTTTSTTAPPTAPASAEPSAPAEPTASDPGAPAPGPNGDLGKPVTVSGVTVRLTDVRSVTASAEPAVSVTLDVRNRRGQGVSLSGAKVFLERAGTRVAPDLSSVLVPASVGAGETVQGTYAFVLAPDARDQITVTVSSPLSGPLVFTGPAPAA